MKGKRGYLLVGIILAIAAALMAINMGGSSFTGNIIRNPNAFIVDIEELSGEISHSIDAKSGESFRVSFACDQGKLQLIIKAEDGEIICDVNNEIYLPDGFVVNINRDCSYEFLLSGRNAKGSLIIEKMNNPMTSGNSDTAEACFDD